MHPVGEAAPGSSGETDGATGSLTGAVHPPERAASGVATDTQLLR